MKFFLDMSVSGAMFQDVISDEISYFVNYFSFTKILSKTAKKKIKKSIFYLILSVCSAM